MSCEQLPILAKLILSFMANPMPFSVVFTLHREDKVCWQLMVAALGSQVGLQGQSAYSGLMSFIAEPSYGESIVP